MLKDILRGLIPAAYLLNIILCSINCEENSELKFFSLAGKGSGYSCERVGKDILMSEGQEDNMILTGNE